MRYKYITLALAGLTAVILLASILLKGAAPQVGVDAHRYADGVLALRFHAAYNAWSWQHPRDREGHAWEHCQQFDAADAKRWKEVRESFAKLDEAMKRAGY